MHKDAEVLISTFAPSVPRTTRRMDWKEFCLDVGIDRPPLDYSDLLDTVGPGVWGGFIECLFPNHNHLYDIGTQYAEFIRTVEHDLEEFEDDPFMVPEVEDYRRMIPWATTANGDIFTWYALGEDPDSWPIYLQIHGDYSYPQLNMSACRFIFQYLDDSLGDLSDLLPRSPSEEYADFETY